MRRVVITGMGVRSALGHHPEALFEAVLAGRSAVRAMPEWADIEDLGSLVAAPVPDFDGREIPRKHRRSMGRVATLAVAASFDATLQAGLDEALLRGGRVGVSFGSTTGSTEAEEEFWRHFIAHRRSSGLKATQFFKVMAHTAATHVALALGIAGEAVATNAACASGTQALGHALDRIRAGRLDVIVAGGAEELHPVTCMTFDGMGGASRAFNQSPTRTPRPFDRDRDGIVVGEGSGALVVEDLDHARARGATPLAEILGFGATSDAVNMASPSPEGMIASIRLALADAGIEPRQIDYVNAHATGTPVGDEAEAVALAEVLGDGVPVSSTKGHLGHTLGACGAVEAILCIRAMAAGVVPPTLNLEHPGVIGIWLPTNPVARPLRICLSTNFAFGGVNTALVLGLPPTED